MNRIKELRLIKKIKQADLAKILGIAQGTLSTWETGRYEPDNNTLKQIANYFGVSVDYLLGLTDYPKEVPGIVDLGDFANIELVANIRAGYHGAAIADASELIAVPSRMLKGYPPQDCKAFVVVGNSMYPQYQDGDYIVVHLQSSVDSGDVAVIIYNGDEASVKKIRYVSGENWLEMIPTNPEYMTKRIEGADLENCFIYGKVISMMRF